MGHNIYILVKKHSLKINAPQVKHTGDSRPTAK